MSETGTGAEAGSSCFAGPEWIHLAAARLMFKAQQGRYGRSRENGIGVMFRRRNPDGGARAIGVKQWRPSGGVVDVRSRPGACPAKPRPWHIRPKCAEMKGHEELTMHPVLQAFWPHHFEAGDSRARFIQYCALEYQGQSDGGVPQQPGKQ